MGFEAVGSLRTSSNGPCSPCETVLGWPCPPVSSLLLLLAPEMLGRFTLWKQSCPPRSSPTACGRTCHPTMCSDPLTHGHQNARGGSSQPHWAVTRLDHPVGSVPFQRCPQHQRGLPEERGGWEAGLAGESSASPGCPMAQRRP